MENCTLSSYKFKLCVDDEQVDRVSKIEFMPFEYKSTYSLGKHIGRLYIERALSYEGLTLLEELDQSDNITINVMNVAGHFRTINVTNKGIIKYWPVKKLDGASSGVAIEAVEISYV